MYLLELAPSLGEDEMTIWLLSIFQALEANLDDVDGGIPAVGHFTGQVALLHRIQEQPGCHIESATLL